MTLASYQPPHTPEAEASILGGIIIANQALDRLDDLEVGDFYDLRHRVVFAAMRKLAARSRPIDVVLLEDEIGRAGKLDAIGGMAFLGELTLRVPTVDNVEHYKGIVKQDARNRRVVLELESALDRAKRGVYEPMDVLSETIGELRQIEATVSRPSDAAPRWHRAPALVELILKYADEPLVSLKLGCDELAVIRQGGIVPVMGPTGAGKSSLVAGMLIAHDGPTVVLSRELPADELAARAIGMQCDASWLDVLTGKVPRQTMERVLMPRLYVLDRKNATLGALEGAIQAAQHEYPGQQVLVAIDYIQILESLAAEARAKVADILAQIDDIARAYRVVVLAISQMSRASSRAARAGEAIGADSTDGGAESAAIERFATMTLSIGVAGPELENGTRAVDLSIGKGRMTGGDRVLPMSYCGRSGRWRLTGEARPAAEVKAEREGQRDNAKQHAAEVAIMVAAKRATEPQARENLSAVACCGKGIRRAAVAALLLRGELVEVASRNPRSRAWKVWTKAQADAAGIPLAGGAS